MCVRVCVFSLSNYTVLTYGSGTAIQLLLTVLSILQVFTHLFGCGSFNHLQQLICSSSTDISNDPQKSFDLVVQQNVPSFAPFLRDLAMMSASVVGSTNQLSFKPPTSSFTPFNS